MTEEKDRARLMEAARERRELIADAAEASERFGDDECERFVKEGTVDGLPGFTFRPKCELVGTDGNVFAIIGTVSRALKRAGMDERAAEWRKRAMEAPSYDAVLVLLHEFVDAY